VDVAKAKGRIRIDPQRCKGCGLCVWACPQQAVDLTEEVDRRGIRVACLLEDKGCTGCRSCYLVCPDVAITVWKETTAKSSRKAAGDKPRQE